MKRWEYIVIDRADLADLTRLGLAGWEVVSVLWREDGGGMFGAMDRVLLKRQKSEAST